MFLSQITLYFVNNKKLFCFILPQHEPNNPHDTHAVAINRMEGKRKCKQVIVGHVPLTLSQIFHLFLKHGGQITVKVTGKHRNKGIGLEIPTTYTFGHKKESKIPLKLSELLNDKEDKGASQTESC